MIEFDFEATRDSASGSKKKIVNVDYELSVGEQAFLSEKPCNSQVTCLFQGSTWEFPGCQNLAIVRFS